MYSDYKTWEDAVSGLPDALLEKPYKRIYLKYDDKWKKTGKKVFKYGAPHIISPHSPDIDENGMEFRSRINIVFLANPGGGKSDIMKEIERLSMNELPTSNQTDADLQKSVASKYGGYRSGNIIVNDLKRIMEQEQLKSIEEMIEEGRVVRKTDDYSIDEEVDCALFGGGVPFEIKDRIVGGFIFRVVPVEVSHSIEEQKEVGEHIRKKMSGDDICYYCDKEFDGDGEMYNSMAFCSSECVQDYKENSTKEEKIEMFSRDDIKSYYRVLKTYIDGEFKDEPAIEGYKFSPDQLKEIEDYWGKSLREFNAKRVNAYWFRQKFDGYRLAANIAILNLPNRDVVEARDGRHKVVVEDVDVEYAKNLMYQGIGLIMDQITDAKAAEKLSKADNLGGENLDKAVRAVDNLQ